MNDVRPDHLERVYSILLSRVIPEFVVGMGLEPAQLSSDRVQKKTDAELKKIILEGSGKMKPVKGLNDIDVGNVIAYVRDFRKKYIMEAKKPWGGILPFSSVTAVPVRLSENVLGEMESQCLQALLVGRIDHIEHLLTLGAITNGPI
jgi:hypothetical protein